MNVQERENAICFMNEKKSKYLNKRKLINGIVFASQKEANRYLQLKDWQDEGIISNLRTQVKYELQPKYRIGIKPIRSITYIADFVYNDRNGNEIVEDVKGFKTEIYKLKKKMFEYKYQKEIKEVY